jgi:hypothetical protein
MRFKVAIFRLTSDNNRAGDKILHGVIWYTTRSDSHFSALPSFAKPADEPGLHQLGQQRVAYRHRRAPLPLPTSRVSIRKPWAGRHQVSKWVLFAGLNGVVCSFHILLRMFQKRRGRLWSGAKLHMDGKCLLEEVLFRLRTPHLEREMRGRFMK